MNEIIWIFLCDQSRPLFSDNGTRVFQKYFVNHLFQTFWKRHKIKFYISLFFFFLKIAWISRTYDWNTMHLWESHILYIKLSSHFSGPCMQFANVTITNYDYTDVTLHYITLHYITLHYITLHILIISVKNIISCMNLYHYLIWYVGDWSYLMIHGFQIRIKFIRAMEFLQAYKSSWWLIRSH